MTVDVVAHDDPGMNAVTFMLAAMVEGIHDKIAVMLSGKKVYPGYDLEGKKIRGALVGDHIAGGHKDK